MREYQPVCLFLGGDFCYFLVLFFFFHFQILMNCWRGVAGMGGLGGRWGLGTLGGADRIYSPSGGDIAGVALANRFGFGF